MAIGRHMRAMMYSWCGVCIFALPVDAEVQTWLIPSGGHFETPNNWSPNGVPGSNDTIRFILQTDYTVSMFDDHTVESLELNGGTDVAFGIAGPSGTRTLQIRENATIETGSLRVRGEGTDSFVMNIHGDLNLTGAQALSVSDGGVLHTSTAQIGSDEGASIDIRGKNSLFNPENLQVSYLGGPRAELTVSDGARISVDSRTSFELADVTLSGEDDDGVTSRWDTGAFEIATGVFRYLDGAIVESASVTYGTASGSPDTSLEGTDSLGRPTTWRITDEMTIWGGTPSIEVRDGAYFRTKNVATRASLASIDIGSSSPDVVSRWLADGNVYLGGVDQGAVGGAELTVNAHGEATITGTLKIWDSGGVILNPFGTMVADRIENQFGGYFSFVGGALQTNLFVGDLHNPRGTITPAGTEAGHTVLVGDYTHGPDATLAFDIGGTTPADHDVLETAGFTFLDGGKLELELINEFSPTANDEFVVASAASIVGSFNNVLNGERLQTIDGTGSFLVNYGFGSSYDMRHLVLSDFLLETILLGDYDGDGFVSAGDLNLVLGAWGDNVSATGVPTGWVNDVPTGLISAAQLNVVLNNWGESSTISLSVPESSSVVLAFLSMLGMAQLRQR